MKKLLPIIITMFALITNVNAQQDGTLDNTFNCGSGIGRYIGKNKAYIQQIAVQADNKLLIAGNYTSFNNKNINYLVRLNSDGTIDSTFQTGSGFIGTSLYPGLNSIAIQSNGKIIVAGSFNSYNGRKCNDIIRLNKDGSYDTTFNSGSGITSNANLNQIYKITLLNNDDVLITGVFRIYNNIKRSAFARLHSDGSLDNTCKLDSNTDITALNTNLVENDGKIIILGPFTQIGSKNINQVARLNANGTLDTTFNIGTGPFNSKNPYDNLFTGIIEPNGKIILGGWFSKFNNSVKASIVRLNADGSVDNTFKAESDTSKYLYISSIVRQSDGKIIIGGKFKEYNGIAANGIARLNADGTTDASFNVGTGIDSTIFAMSIQNDNKILISGDFAKYNGVSVSGLARLNVGVSSVEEIATIDTYKIFPNPSNGRLFVESQNKKEMLEQVNVYNLQGKCLHQQKAEGSHAEINVEGLSQGIYIVEIINESGAKSCQKIAIK